MDPGMFKFPRCISTTQRSDVKFLGLVLGCPLFETDPFFPHPPLKGGGVFTSHYLSVFLPISEMTESDIFLKMKALDNVSILSI